MGFSFSGIREELDSKELGKLYRRLQADCRYLAPFADWKAVVAFLHDQKRGYRLKDRILWRLIQYYRQGGDCERLGVVFLAIFEPAILGLYSSGAADTPISATMTCSMDGILPPGKRYIVMKGSAVVVVESSLPMVCRR